MENHSIEPGHQLLFYFIMWHPLRETTDDCINLYLILLLYVLIESIDISKYIRFVNIEYNVNSVLSYCSLGIFALQFESL